MRRFIFVLTLCFIFGADLGVAKADTLINFEDLPDANIVDFCGGGGQSIGNFYSSLGVANIATNVFGLTPAACGITGYPPSSGSIDVISEDDIATISFTSPVSSVSLDYAAIDRITLAAYDGSNNLLESITGSANTDGVTGSDSLLSLNFANISYVTLGNTGLADGFTFDDLSFTPQQASPVPEPASWLLLMAGLALLPVVKRISARHPIS
jgi:hypothetical protein